jgi:hypothetical protein
MRKRVAVAEERLADAWARVPTGASLETTDGQPVRVVYPGRRNRAAGPDYLDAVLETPSGETRGAVEIHQRASDWERHGHGADRNYAGVVLHVVGRDDGAPSRTPGGVQLPLLELAVVDVADGPAGAARFPCTASGDADVRAALQFAGDARFEATVGRLRDGLDECGGEIDQLAYEEIATALGYSRNEDAMRDVARLAPMETVRRAGEGGTARRAEALLLGAAGLLPSQRHLSSRRRRDAYVELLERLWRESHHGVALRAYRWDHGQNRPENGPVRRVLALAGLALRWPPAGLEAALRAALEGATARRALAAHLHVPSDNAYWRTHWDFGVAARGSTGGALEERSGNQAPSLLGSARAADIVVNVLLPLAAALGEGNGDARLAQRAREAYRTHPALMENWITRLVRERSGRVAASDVVPGAREQQGLIDVHERTCHALRCAACALNPRSGAG